MTVLTSCSPADITQEPVLMDKEVLPSLCPSPPGPLVSVTSGSHSLCPGDSGDAAHVDIQHSELQMPGSQRWSFPFAFSFQIFSESGNN